MRRAGSWLVILWIAVIAIVVGTFFSPLGAQWELCASVRINIQSANEMVDAHRNQAAKGTIAGTECNNLYTCKDKDPEVRETIKAVEATVEKLKIHRSLTPKLDAQIREFQCRTTHNVTPTEPCSGFDD